MGRTPPSRPTSRTSSSGGTWPWSTRQGRSGSIGSLETGGVTSAPGFREWVGGLLLDALSSRGAAPWPSPAQPGRKSSPVCVGFRLGGLASGFSEKWVGGCVCAQKMPPWPLSDPLSGTATYGRRTHYTIRYPASCVFFFVSPKGTNKEKDPRQSFLWTVFFSFFHALQESLFFLLGF